MVYTVEQRPTDIDMVGLIDSRDEQALEDAGFVRAGRHWAFDWPENEGFLVEVPSRSLWDEETAEEIDVGGHGLRVVSVNDLMMDRLTQATDGTQITRALGARLPSGRQARRSECHRSDRNATGVIGMPQSGLTRTCSVLETGDLGGGADVEDAGGRTPGVCSPENAPAVEARPRALRSLFF